MDQRDLTKGSVFSALCFFAMPMILGNMMQQGYNIADTWVVGHFAGSGALGAVGSAFSLMTCLTSVLIGLCMGSGVVFSVRFGRKDEEGLKDCARASFFLVAAIAAVLTSASLLCINQIISWMNIPEEMTGMAKDYLVPVFWGIPAVALYNFFGSYLKALGNSVAPLIFLGISTFLNIGLDLLFVAALDRGVAGAAAATVLSQYASGAGIGIYAWTKQKEIRAAFRRFTVSRSGLAEIANYSVLTCLQQSVMNFGILMVQGLVNCFGAEVMAAFAAAVKIEAFSYMPVQEYGNACSTFLAQNAGAKRTDRILRGIRCAAVTVVCYCLLASLLLWFLAEPLMLLFIRPGETDVVAEGVRYLHAVGPFYFGIGCLFLFYGLFRALGKPAVSVGLTVISLGVRVGLSYLLAAGPAKGEASLLPIGDRLGVAGIWHSIPVGWILADLAGVLFYLKMRRSLIRTAAGGQKESFL